MTKKRVQSPSSINMFRQCPRKYFFRYIEKLPTVPNIHLVRGSAVHKVLEDFFDIDTSQINMKNYDVELRKKLQHMFVCEWKKNREEIQKYTTSADEEKFYFSESLLMVLNWLDHFIGKVKSFEGLSFNEIFEKLTPLREEEYKSYDLYVRGFIDAIEQDENEVRIIDYKTNKRLEIDDKQRLQLAIYALLYRETHGKIPEKAGIFFLRSKPKYIKINEELLEEAKKEINFVHENTQSKVADDYPLKTGPLCNWCDFYKMCFKNMSVEEFRSDVKKVTP